jgi:hypothetical protein
MQQRENKKTITTKLPPRLPHPRPQPPPHSSPTTFQEKEKKTI